MGSRPIDLHLSSLKQLGCVFEHLDSGEVKVSTTHTKSSCVGTIDCIKGTEIYLQFPSVGATENIMLAAVCGDGITVVRNAAKEPEIVDLQKFLNSAGYMVFGAGTSDVTIVGNTNTCNYVKHKIMPDRIVAGTYMYAAAITQGDVLIKDVSPDNVMPMIKLLETCGCDIDVKCNELRVVCNKRLCAPETIRTMPYPGYPTDMQAITASLLAVADGTSIIVENVFEARFKYVDELRKMGADICVENKVAVINGVRELFGTNVEATDLRAGAALVIAALAANAKTTINDVIYIDRGYQEIENKLSQLGADIKRIKG